MDYAASICSGLFRRVLGQDDKLTDQIIKACDDLKPTMVTVLGSPVPMLIGTDMHGIAREIETRSGLPSFRFNTSRLYDYNKGISDVITVLPGSRQRFNRGASTCWE